MERAEAYLEQIPMWTKKKHSLEQIRQVLDRLGAPDRSLPAVHVAGTNGKGSVCAFLTSVLREGGLRVGTFISPHLAEVRERFLVNGVMADQALFEESFQEVLTAVRELEQEGVSHPAYFEFLFYMAMVLFRRSGVELAVIETGLGGRLDATNVLERPLACVITSISLDHTQYLGDTIEKIAAEKAGIIKAGVPVIFDNSVPEASAVIEGTAFRLRAARYPVGRGDVQINRADEAGLSMEGRLLNGGTLELLVPFEASCQAVNAMLAVRTAQVLRCRAGESSQGRLAEGLTSLTGQTIQRGIRKTVWPGRMERAAEGIYLDGAHNPGGIAAFVEAAREIADRRKQRAFLLFAAVSDKDYGSMIQMLKEKLDWQAIGVVHINSDRGLSAGLLARAFREGAACPVYSYESSAEALADMRAQAKGELLFCAGSLYLIGELKQQIAAEGREADD